MIGGICFTRTLAADDMILTWRRKLPYLVHPEGEFAPKTTSQGDPQLVNAVSGNPVKVAL